MNKYVKYKPSGIEWIGEIPEHWDLKKIKHCCYVKGRVGWNGLKASEFLTKGFAYLVTGTDFKNGLVDWDNCYHIDEERYIEDPFIQLKNEDLLITKDGTIGKLAIVEQFNKPACLNSGIFVVRSLLKTFSTRYLYWILRSDVFNNFNGYTSYGSTIQHLYQNVFFEFNFCFPSSEEQTVIANFLDEKTAQLDKLITNKQKLIELLKEERTAVINHYVLGKHLIDNGQLTMDNSQLPTHWEVKKLKYLARILSGYSPEQCKPSINNGNIPYIKVDNLNVENPNIDVAKENTTEEFIVSKKPSILFPKRGAAIALNKVAFADFSFCMDTNLMGLEIFDKSLTDIQFIYYWFKSISLISIADTSTIPQINNKHVEPLYICLPPLKEQNQIVHLIGTETKRIDATILKIEKEIELLQEYRTALISEVVTGKIKII